MEIKNWIAKTKNISITKKDKQIIITNNSDIEGKAYGKKIIKCKNEHVNLEFKAETTSGSGAISGAEDR